MTTIDTSITEKKTIQKVHKALNKEKYALALRLIEKRTVKANDDALSKAFCDEIGLLKARALEGLGRLKEACAELEQLQGSSTVRAELHRIQEVVDKRAAALREGVCHICNQSTESSMEWKAVEKVDQPDALQFRSTNNVSYKRVAETVDFRYCSKCVGKLARKEFAQYAPKSIGMFFLGILASILVLTILYFLTTALVALSGPTFAEAISKMTGPARALMGTFFFFGIIMGIGVVIFILLIPVFAWVSVYHARNQKTIVHDILFDVVFYGTELYCEEPAEVTKTASIGLIVNQMPDALPRESDALYRLGCIHEFGLSGEIDYDAAFDLYKCAKRAADDENNKHYKATSNSLGATNVGELKRLADNKQKARYALAGLYMRGRGTPANSVEAIRLLRECEEEWINKYSPALVQLGYLHERGLHLTQDRDSSITYYDKAVAVEGDVYCMAKAYAKKRLTSLEKGGELGIEPPPDNWEF